MTTKFGFHLVDIIALLVFFIAWFSHYWRVNHGESSSQSISNQMTYFRHQWMREMVYRDTRVVDSLLQNSLQQGVLFFASTSILLVGALLAGLGASDQAVALLKDLPLSTTTSRQSWEVKVLLVVFIFTFAFFKFAWSYRLFTYVLIMLGATPPCDSETGELNDYAAMVAQLQALGSRHFTIGLNAYFFALPAVVWLLNPWLFIASSLWVAMVLNRRAFHSNFVKVLNGDATRVV